MKLCHKPRARNEIQIQETFRITNRHGKKKNLFKANHSEISKAQSKEIILNAVRKKSSSHKKGRDTRITVELLSGTPNIREV